MNIIQFRPSRSTIFISYATLTKKILNQCDECNTNKHVKK